MTPIMRFGRWGMSCWPGNAIPLGRQCAPLLCLLMWLCLLCMNSLSECLVSFAISYRACLGAVIISYLRDVDHNVPYPFLCPSRMHDCICLLACFSVGDLQSTTFTARKPFRSRYMFNSFLLVLFSLSLPLLTGLYRRDLWLR